MSEEIIQLDDLRFAPYLSAEEIERTVDDMARDIRTDFAGKNPILIGVLNGAFMFLADLSRKLDIQHEIEFVKLSSYEGTESTGDVQFELEVMTHVQDRDLIIVEDIVDTGLTMKTFREHILKKDINSVSIATLLFKKDLFEYDYPIDYIGRQIPPVFVVGYGLDYNGLGRNLPMLYRLAQ